MLRKVKRSIPSKSSPLRPMKLSKSLSKANQDVQEIEKIQEVVDSPISSASKSPSQIQQEQKSSNESTIVPTQTVLSKQIRILSQLNCKQVEALIADRATIKAHGLASKMSFYDSLHSDVVDIIYYDDNLSISQFPQEFNREEEKIIKMLRSNYNDPNPRWYDWNSTFGAVEKIHKYFNENQMRKYIPIKFTYDKNHPDYEPPIKKTKR